MGPGRRRSASPPRAGRAPARRIVPVTAALLTLPPRSALAHGFRQRYDLPVPLWLWATAAATAVTLSFVVIGIFVRARPGAPDYWRLDLVGCSPLARCGSSLGWWRWRRCSC